MISLFLHLYHFHFVSLSSIHQTLIGLDLTIERTRVIGCGLIGLRHPTPIGLMMLPIMADTAVRLLERVENGMMGNVVIN